MCFPRWLSDRVRKDQHFLQVYFISLEQPLTKLFQSLLFKNSTVGQTYRINTSSSKVRRSKVKQMIAMEKCSNQIKFSGGESQGKFEIMSC